MSCGTETLPLPIPFIFASAPLHVYWRFIILCSQVTWSINTINYLNTKNFKGTLKRGSPIEGRKWSCKLDLVFRQLSPKIANSLTNL